MRPDPIERNLLLLLDPSHEAGQGAWRFIDWRASSRASMISAAESETCATVYCFARRDLLGYLLFCRQAKRRPLPCAGRKILYLNDGLLSSMFDEGNTAGYRAFAAGHLPPSKGLRKRLASLLPPAVRAEKRFVVVGRNRALGELDPGPAAGEETAILRRHDFMFFSNPSGKLLLTSAETMRCGTGSVLKTTANPSYARVMEKEFSTMLGIAGLPGGGASLPRVGARMGIGKRVFFTEAYVPGRTLRDLLHSLSRKNDLSSIRGLLDRLDQWYERYRAAFRGESRPLASCYAHLFDALPRLYGQHPDAGAMQEATRRTFAVLSGKEVGIATMTSHNDLWPGNFVVGADGLVAIDWERAVGNRAPLFDYYWMIISAALEHLVCRIGTVDYSRAFRLFLLQDDDVSRHATKTMETFLDRLGLDRDLHPSFLLLFLMEWSVQGYLALGRQTAMDRLAFGELIAMVGTLGEREFSP